MSARAVQLGEVCEVVMGQSPPSSTYNTSGDGLPFFQGKADFGDIFPNTRVYCSQPSRVAEPGDILISVRAPVGPTNLARERSCIGRGLSALRSSKPLNAVFLFYFLRYYEPQLARRGLGSTFAAINRDDLEETLIPLPDLSEQKRIAAQLERANRLRRTRRFVVELSDTFLHASFLEFFGDSQTSFEIYQVKCLEEVVQQDRGVTYGIVQAGPHVADGIPYIKTGDIVDGVIRGDFLSRTSQEIAQSYKRSEVKFGDLIISIRATVGTIAVLPKELDCANLTQGTARIAPSGEVEKLFLLWQIRMPEAQRWIRKQVKGSTFLEITLARLREMPVFVPPLLKQKQFSALVQRHERLQARQREALRQADHLFQSLLHRAFSENG